MVWLQSDEKRNSFYWVIDIQTNFDSALLKFIKTDCWVVVNLRVALIVCVLLVVAVSWLSLCPLILFSLRLFGHDLHCCSDTTHLCASWLNKTSDNRRHIFRLPFLIEMIFKGMIAFFSKNTLFIIFSIFPNIKIFRYFRTKPHN